MNDAYRVEGVVLSEPERTIHRNAAVACLAALVELDPNEGTREAFAAEALNYGDALVIAYRMRCPDTDGEIYRLSRDKDAIEAFMRSGGDAARETQRTVLRSLTVRNTPTSRANIRKLTQASNGTINALERRGLIVLVEET